MGNKRKDKSKQKEIVYTKLSTKNIFPSNPYYILYFNKPKSLKEITENHLFKQADSYIFRIAS